MTQLFSTNQLGTIKDSIEGLQSNPRATLKQVREVLAQNGIEIEIPNRKAEAIKLLRNAVQTHKEAIQGDLSEELTQTPVAKEKPASALKNGQSVAYVRVSTELQNTERQFSGELDNFDRVFTEKASAKTTARPELDKLCQHVRSNDTVHVWSIDRLARNLVDLRKLVEDWLQQGVSVKFHKEQLHFDAHAPAAQKAMQMMMLNMLGSFAEFELAIRAERQREGIAIASKAGKYKGRQKSIDRAKVQELLAGGMGASAIAKELGIGRKTVYRIKEEIEQAKDKDQPELI